jgi:hypothetical protein
MTENQTPAAKATRARRLARLDETGEGSFPASDPPQSWTWDVHDERESRTGRFSASQKQPAPSR